MATTTNFGWETPDDTDLVKDGALAIRTLGNSIDTSLVDLKGGTTGQVLSKTSNTDMDFTWVTSDDANAIQNAIVDAKGDLIAASAADTPARLAVGNNGETLLADSSATTGLRWQGNYAAGKNKLINGDFQIWQRGTSFTPAVSTETYSADRWFANRNGTGATVTVSQQSFTAGTAPVAGYEGQYFLRYDQSVAGTTGTFNVIGQKIEDVRTFAGQTVTVSFWAKSDSTRTVTVQLRQNFGSGGSSSVDLFSSALTTSTSWQRFTYTTTLGSISGKTLGSNNFLSVQFSMANNTAQTVDYWGIQIEAGNTATAFQTATGTLAGELALAQRYYQRFTNTVAQTLYAHTGINTSSTRSFHYLALPVAMRGTPSVAQSGAVVGDTVGSNLSVSAIAVYAFANPSVSLDVTHASGYAASAPVFLALNQNNYIELSAEL